MKSETLKNNILEFYFHFSNTEKCMTFIKFFHEG